MSDPALESKEELRKAVEAVTRKQSQSSEELSPVSPSSSLGGSFSSAEMKIAMAESSVVESQPDGWTVVDVNRDASPKPTPSNSSSEGTKPLVSPKPQPAPPLKPKPKSPVSYRGNSVKKFTFPVTASGGNGKTSKTEQPRMLETTAASNIESTKRFSDYSEILINETENKKKASASTGAGVKSKTSLFEGGGPVKPAVYAKPDMSKKSSVAKNTVNNDTKPVTIEKAKKEDSAEPPPLLPDRRYTQEDLKRLKPLPVPPSARNGPLETSPKENGIDSLQTSKPPEQSSENTTENPYEIVEARNVKPSAVLQQKKPVVPSPPPHNKRVEKRKDLPTAPPSPFMDRVPPAPMRGVSLSTASIPSSPKQQDESVDWRDVAKSGPPASERQVEPDYWDVEEAKSSLAKSEQQVEPDYWDVGEAKRSLAKSEPEYSSVMEAMSSTPKSESPYSEVEDSRKPVEELAYFTTDIVRNLPTKGGVETKRQQPAIPSPYKMKTATEGEQHLPSSSGVEKTATPPPIPPPYRPQNIPGAATSSRGDQLQSPETAASPLLPIVVPGSPRLHSAKLVSDSSPSSIASSPVLDRSPKFKPPPPPRVSSIADVTKEEVTGHASVADGRSYSPVNGITEREDINEIPTRDVNARLTSPKPFVPPKPQFGSTSMYMSETNGPPRFKPPPPPKSSSLIPRAYDAKPGSMTSDHERGASQNGTDAFGIIAPPPLGWMDTKDERSTSTTSVDSLDLKIVPPPPVHFNGLDPVNLTFETQDIKPPPDWQWERDKNANVRAPKKGSRKSDSISDFDFSIVPPPPPPSEPPPTLPASGPVDYELDLVPSLLSGGPEGLNIDDILGNLDKSLSLPSNRYDGVSDDEDSLPPAPLPPGERYPGVPPPPGDLRIKPLVPPLRKQR